MSEAHDTNDSGIQHFSATQSSDQVAEALAKAYPEKYEFEKQDFTTAPLSAPVEGTPQQLDAQGNVIPPPVTEPVVDPAAPQAGKIKPGRFERERNRRLKAEETLDATRREIAELRGLVLGKQTVAPPVVAAPVVEKPVETAAVVETPVPVEPAKFDKPRPKREDFFDAPDPDVAYEDAIADWKLDGREFARQAISDAAKANEERQKEAKASKDAADANKTAESEWEASQTAARAEFQDFDDVWKTPHFDDEKKPLPIKNNAMDYVAKHWTDDAGKPTGARILYWLGTHPKEANAIALKTVITDPNDAKAVERSIRAIHKEFDKIETDLAAHPPKPKEKPVAQVTPPVEVDDLEDDELEDDERVPEDSVDVDPAAGKKVEQQPTRGTVDTKPPVSQQPPVRQAEPKPDPISRVGSRGHTGNRPVVALPEDAVRALPPNDYRAKRAAEGSPAARG